MSKKYISTLEFYNYGESNKMEPALGASYKVKVSDKDGNIITIEKDDSLYACVKLAFNPDTGVLSLLDVAHNDSVLAEIEMPNADYIYNCRYDEETNAILFDVKSLYGNDTDTIELDVESLVELYEAGQGIEIGEKNEVTGRKPISIKLAEGEELLQLTDSGLGLDGKVITEEELDEAISGKADTQYVDELFDSISGLPDAISSITEDIESIETDIDKIKSIIGTDEDDPNLDERIDSKADLDEFNDLENEVGELEVQVNTISGNVDSLTERVTEAEGKINEHDGKINGLEDDVEYISGVVSTSISEINNKIEEIENDIDTISGEVENNKVTVEKLTEDLPTNVREAYILKNNLGEQLGERIDIYKDSSLISIEFIPEEQILRYKFYEADGSIRTVDVDLSELVVNSEFKDGLVVDDGKVSVKIDPTSDGYLTVSENGVKLSGVFEMFGQLLEVNSQQWAAINAETTARQEVDDQIWGALEREINARQEADDALREIIVPEDVIDAKIASATTAIDGKIDGEIERAILAETALSGAIQQEISRATGKENELATALENEIADREAADINIQQEVTTKLNSMEDRVQEVEDGLANETATRLEKDAELEAEIGVVKETYATVEYVDNKDGETFRNAVTSAVTTSNAYTDNEIDSLEVELKQYCDSGHTELQQGISQNATKINAISNLYGVIGDDTSNYDDSGNGILDVLHREFHAYVDSGGSIKEIKVEDGKLIIVYYTSEGEKTIEIELSSLVDLSDYYKKEETDALLDEKADASELADVAEHVSANTENIVALTDGMSGITDGVDELFERLGYADNDTLVKNGEREVAFGQYNVSNTSEDASGRTIFSIGNGTDENNRSNAVEVREDGTVYMWIEGDFMNVNRLLAQISHEVYDTDTTNNPHFFDGD